MRGTSCSASITASRRTSAPTTASTGTTVRRSATASPDGCNYDAHPEKNTDYYGSGFFQRISTHHAHQQFDWIIKVNLNHSTIAWDRWFMGGNHISAGANWPQRLWEGTRSDWRPGDGRGPADHEVQRREHPMSPIGLEGWPKFGYEKNDRWQFSNDLTWVKGATR